ncbi:MAG TPA: sigma-54 dependent transcriptional regulator [Gemmatimonadaceae bacterium]|nr:sigma-54 dependent transcriptional regulator [Gemmatimonadaceae bacterium]
MATILHVDDEPDVGLILEDTIRRAGHRPIAATNATEAMRALSRGAIDLVVSDDRIPGIGAVEFLELLRGEGYDTPFIMMTGWATVEQAVAAIKAGAVDFITKPIRPAQLEVAVEHALELARLRRENDALHREVTEVRHERRIIGDSPAIRRALQGAATVAPTSATVLLHGESGTGKELFARAIHELGDRRDRPLIMVNCAALPDGLVECALFGQEKGALAGATQRVEGALERAHGGTLLLDDIAELRLELQGKLLRLLQEQEFERVGGTVPVRADVRVLATTNRDLAAEVAAGRFRRDLFVLLSAVSLRIPPLRERPEDIPLLAHRFAMRAAADAGKTLGAIAPDAIALLQRHDWPGNVRELRRAVERAVILEDASVLGSQAFVRQWPALAPAATLPPRSPAAGAAHAGEIVLRSLDVAEAEAVLIQHALAATGNNRTRAAALLGISVRTLRNKLNGQRQEPSVA